MDVTGETALVAWQCDACGAAAHRQVNQFVERGALRWDTEHWCACGQRFCVHGGLRSGATPESVRTTILAANGGARLTLPMPPSRLSILRVLRDSPEVSGGAVPDLGTARRLAEDVAAGLFCGTWCEMTLIARRLRGRGVEAGVERLALPYGSR